MLGIVAVQYLGDADAEIDGLELFAVGNSKADALASFLGEDAVVGGVLDGLDLDAGKVGLVEFGGEFCVVDVGGADDFKWSGSASSDGEGGHFKEADSGIEGGGDQATHVGGWVGPRQGGLVKPDVSLPVFKRDDLKI